MRKVVEYENLRKLNEPFFLAFKAKFQKTLESGWYILGEEVGKFEKEFADYCGSKYCIGVASGLDAITLSLLCLDLPKNSEVILPANTYIASVLAVIKAGLTPILIEPNINTYNIDVSKIEKRINKNTKVILPVHLYGKVSEMELLMDLANKYDLKIIEDCAQSHGARINKKMAGTFGDFGAFSFYPTKNLGALGDAGAIITDSLPYYKKLKALRNYGSEIKYNNKYIGLNSRLDELQAGFLSIKLKHLNKINEHKRKLAKYYFENLSDDLIKPELNLKYYDVFHIYNIRTEKRDELKHYLEVKGIKTEIHYPIPPHKQIGYKNYFENSYYPISEEIHETTLSLPISYFHSIEDIKHVCEQINRFL